MAMHLPLSKSVGESINNVEQTHRSQMASNAATNVLALACVSSVPAQLPRRRQRDQHARPGAGSLHRRIGHGCKISWQCDHACSLYPLEIPGADEPAATSTPASRPSVSTCNASIQGFEVALNNVE